MPGTPQVVLRTPAKTQTGGGMKNVDLGGQEGSRQVIMCGLRLLESQRAGERGEDAEQGTQDTASAGPALPGVLLPAGEEGLVCWGALGPCGERQRHPRSAGMKD